jgi:hypothetical protein
MKSTGEVLCVGRDFNEVFQKANLYIRNSHLFPQATRENFSCERDPSISIEVYPIPKLSHGDFPSFDTNQISYTNSL